MAYAEPRDLAVPMLTVSVTVPADMDPETQTIVACVDMIERNGLGKDLTGEQRRRVGQYLAMRYEIPPADAST
jgi:hypothetical protein